MHESEDRGRLQPSHCGKGRTNYGVVDCSLILVASLREVAMTTHKKLVPWMV